MRRHGVGVVVVIKPVIAPVRNENVSRDTFGVAELDKFFSCETARRQILNRHAFAQGKRSTSVVQIWLCASMWPRVNRPGETQPVEPAAANVRACRRFISAQVRRLRLSCITSGLLLGEW